MKMKLILIAFTLLITSQLGYSQIRLEDCINKALEASPVLKNKSAIDGISKLELDNNKNSVYPDFNIAGLAKYQSEVVDLSVDFPLGDISFPEIPHFQYNLGLNVNQVLYDGGRRKLEREIILNRTNEKLEEIEIIHRELIESVQNLYLNILLITKQLEILQLMKSTLNTSMERVISAVEGGIARDLDVQLLEVESLHLNRKLVASSKSRESMISSLSILCGVDIDPESTFELPLSAYKPLAPNRAEFNLYEYRNKNIELSKQAAGLKNSPRLFAFGQAAFGRPGLNFMSDSGQDYYVAGLQFLWKPWDYNSTKRLQSALELQAKMIDNERSSFNQQLELAIRKVYDNIELAKKMIEEDEKMIVVREAIRKTMGESLEAGLATSSDYVLELNKEQEARLNLEKSKMELLANYLAYEILNGVNH